MKVPPIETDEEYDAALARLMELIELMDSSDGKAGAEEREALLQAIEAYEDEVFPEAPLAPRG
jgi:hypothetical protein